MSDLSHLRVAVIATDAFEEQELTEPVKALREAGARVDIIAPQSGQIQAFRHHDKGVSMPVDRTLDEAKPEEYDALELPGGALNADQLRILPQVQNFVKEFDRSGKPIAFICHAPWELISAGLVKGRTLTSYHTIRDDIENAGGTWVDQEVCVDGNWISSRQPDDLPAFNREMLSLFARSPAGATR